MANLNDLHNDLTQAKDIVIKLYDDHAFTQSDLTKAAELAAEAHVLLMQVAADFEALDAALTKSRG